MAVLGLIAAMLATMAGILLVVVGMVDLGWYAWVPIAIVVGLVRLSGVVPRMPGAWRGRPTPEFDR